MASRRGVVVQSAARKLRRFGQSFERGDERGTTAMLGIYAAVVIFNQSAMVMIEFHRPDNPSPTWTKVVKNRLLAAGDDLAAMAWVSSTVYRRGDVAGITSPLHNTLSVRSRPPAGECDRAIEHRLVELLITVLKIMSRTGDFVKKLGGISDHYADTIVETQLRSDWRARARRSSPS